MSGKKKEVVSNLELNGLCFEQLRAQEQRDRKREETLFQSEKARNKLPIVIGVTDEGDKGAGHHVTMHVRR